jgi:tRNA threonylcarbamoyladenosine biosynthesis protein TsaE
MNRSIVVDNLAALPEAARRFVQLMEGRTVFAFYAPMGAGKTTFIQAVCEALGVIDPVGSPTFSIINEYRRDAATPVYHFDFYRIKTLEEAYNTGCEDYFYSGACCFIEWPEKVEDILPADAVAVTIEERGGQRVVEILQNKSPATGQVPLQGMDLNQLDHYFV